MRLMNFYSKKKIKADCLPNKVFYPKKKSKLIVFPTKYFYIFYFRLLGSTILFVLSKMVEIYPPESYDFVRAPLNAFDVDQLMEKELKIINVSRKI